MVDNINQNLSGRTKEPIINRCFDKQNMIYGI